MELSKACNLFKERVKKENIYKKIVVDDNSVFLGTLYLLKTYKDYILCTDKLHKSVKIQKLTGLSREEEYCIGNLLEACIIFSESVGIDYKEPTIIFNDPLVDPYDIVDILLKDYITNTLSDDQKYQDIIISIYSLLNSGNSTEILKNLFLKFTYIKKWR